MVDDHDGDGDSGVVYIKYKHFLGDRLSDTSLSEHVFAQNFTLSDNLSRGNFLHILHIMRNVKI